MSRMDFPTITGDEIDEDVATRPRLREGECVVEERNQMYWRIGLVQCTPPSDVAGVVWRRIGYKPMTKRRVRPVSRKEQVARHGAFAVQRRGHLTALLHDIGNGRPHVIAIVGESRPECFVNR